MSEMVERIAGALRAAGLHEDFDVRCALATAVLEEMRKPTKAMLDNAMPHMDSWSSNLAWWDKMIDGALK